MESSSLKKILLLVLVVSLTLSNSALSQLTPEEVYKVHVLKLNTRGNSEKQHAFFFHSMGLGELERLKNEKRRYRGLAPEKQLRLELLEDALSPITEVINARRNTSDRETRLALNQKFVELLNDTDNYRLVFDALGGDRALELTTKGLAASLKNISKSSITNAYSPATILNNELVLKLLSFSDLQKKEFEKLKIEVTEKMRFGAEGEVGQMEDVLSRHWKSILSSLDATQSDTVKQLVGEPIQWFRGSANNQLRRRDFSNHGGPVVNPGTIDESIKTDDGRSIFQMTPAELGENGIDFLYSHIYEMMSSPFIWDELELSKEQRSDLKQNKLDAVGLPSFHQERLVDLLKEKEVNYPKSMKSILQESQLTWFRQMELQVLTGQYESSIGLLHPMFVERLTLRRRQQEKIKELAKKYSMEIQVLQKSLIASRKETRLEFEAAIQDLLTEEQKAIFQKLTGRQIQETNSQRVRN